MDDGTVCIRLQSMSDDDDEADNAKNGGRFRRPFWFSTLFWLTYRLMLATAREPTIIALRMGQKVVSTASVNVSNLRSSR